MATTERRKTPPGAPKYHRLTDEKRIIIEALRKEECLSSAEARFTSPNQNCYNTDNKQESFVSTGLRNECCTGYWMAGTNRGAK